jgi:hypothetical protein
VVVLNVRIQSTLAETSDFFAILLDVLAATLDLLTEIGHFLLVAQTLRVDAVNFAIAGAAVAVLSAPILGGAHGPLAALTGSLFVLHQVTAVIAKLVNVTTVASNVPLFAVNTAEVVVLGHVVSRLEERGHQDGNKPKKFWYTIDTLCMSCTQFHAPD